MDAIQPGGRVWSLIHPSSLEAEFRLQPNHPPKVLNEFWINKINFTFHEVSKYIYSIQLPKNYTTSSTSSKVSSPSFQPSGIAVSVSLLCWSGGKIYSICCSWLIFKVPAGSVLLSPVLLLGILCSSSNWLDNGCSDWCWHSTWCACWHRLFKFAGYEIASMLQAGTCQIFSLAENPRWSRVWQ